MYIYPHMYIKCRIFFRTNRAMCSIVDNTPRGIQNDEYIKSLKRWINLTPFFEGAFLINDPSLAEVVAFVFVTAPWAIYLSCDPVWEFMFHIGVKKISGVKCVSPLGPYKLFFVCFS